MLSRAQAIEKIFNKHGDNAVYRDVAKENLYVYVLDNGCHESVGGQYCSPLEETYTGITEVIKISCDGKLPRVEIGFEENARNIISMFKIN